MINNGLWGWVKQHVSWQLGVALCLSLLVHLLLMREFSWPGWFSDEPAVHTLQAHLEVPQPKPTSPPPVKRLAKQKPPVSKPAPVPPVENKVEPAPPQAVEDIAAEPAGMPEEDAETAEEELEAERQAEIAAWHEMDNAFAAPTDETMPPPYRHVSTEFSVFVNGEDRPAGSARIDYVQEAPQQYALNWVVEGRGLLKLLYPTLEQQSRGEISTHGLKPQVYRYAFGSRSDKIYEAFFDWETNFITLKTAKGEQRHDLPRNTQDILSFMYQFMFVPPLEEMHVSLTNGRRLGAYQYEFEGEDMLTIADQPVQTVHIAHTRGETDEKIELWLATDYRYVPVKIKKLEKNGMVIEQVATRLITE